MKTRQGIAALILGFACVATANAREWTDTTGDHKIEAEYSDYRSGVVRLEKTDGSIVNIPLSKLSSEDQKIVRNILKNNRSSSRASKAAGLNPESGLPLNTFGENGGRGMQRGPGMERGGPGMERGGPGMERGGPGMQRGGPGMQRGGPGMQRGGLGMQRGRPGMQGPKENVLFHVTMTINGQTREFTNPVEAYGALQQFIEMARRNPELRAALEAMQLQRGPQRGGLQGGQRGGLQGGQRGGPQGGQRGPQGGHQRGLMGGEQDFGERGLRAREG